jgi:hypothetical protein
VTLSFGKILKPFFRLSPETFGKLVAERYGQQEDIDRTWRGFEPVARTLVDSFKATLDDSRFEVLVPQLDAVDIELRGIAYEGAGMGLMLLDSLGPWKKRLQAFLDGPGAPYICLVYIGAGLVMPRLPTQPECVLTRLDPLLGWMAIDGYGFYEGFFSGQRTVMEHQVPARITGYARRAFDHGLGRSLWFSTAANVERIHKVISVFPQERQGDLWSGIGLACAYAAGVVDRKTIQVLQKVTGPHQSQMAVGAAMAAMFRQQAHSFAPHTELACDVLWGLSGKEVAHITDITRQDLLITPQSGACGGKTEPAYEIWRQRIAAQYIERTASVYQQKETKQ